MNEQPKTKNVRGDSIANAGNGTQSLAGAKRRTSRRKSAEPNRISAAADPIFHPARNFMIDLGWLRLFREIVSDGISLASRPLTHEP